MIKKEWKKLSKSPILMIVLAAIVLIPSIYATFFLASMWDPYGQLEKLPVAVVNLDEPVTYNEKRLSVGENLVDSLKQNKELDFHFVDAAHADEGIHSGEYYMVITIPKDFSKNASTLMNEHPKQMNIDYETNPGTNYIASKLSHTALTKIENKVADEVTRTYAETLFDQLSTIGDGMEAGAKGAAQLKDGTQKLIDGNEKIHSNLNVLANSTITFRNGSQTLQKGLTDYTNGVTQLADGTKNLKNGANQLVQGSSNLNNGIQNYIAGVNALENGADQLAGLSQIDQVYSGILSMKNAVNDGSETTPSLKSGTQQLADGLTALDAQTSSFIGQASSDMQTSSASLNSAANVIDSAIATLSQNNTSPEMDGYIQALTQESNTLHAMAQQLPQSLDISALQALTSGIHSASVSANAIAQGTSELANGLDALEQSTRAFPAAAAGIVSLQNGFHALTQNNESLVQGASQLNSGTIALNNGANTLKNGTDALTSNNQKLLDGAGTLSSGAEKINEGAAQLAEGSSKVQDGLNELQTGSGKLNTALSDGAKTIRENTASGDTLDMFSTPVTSTETQVTQVPNNGSAMSAYMMCVGLWVGCLAFCLMYPLTHYEGQLNNGCSWWLSKASIAYPLALLMAFIMLLILRLFCGFTPIDFGKTALVACMAACTFMAIMYFFNVALGKIGSFVMLIFMVIQLAGSAGTYPVELSAGFVAKIHNLLPFSYVVEAFRMGICGEGSIKPAMGMLSIWLILFTLLTILLFTYRAHRIQENKKTLYDHLEHFGLA